MRKQFLRLSRYMFNTVTFTIFNYKKLVYLSEDLDNLVFIVEFLIIIGMQMLVIYLSRGLIR